MLLQSSIMATPSDAESLSICMITAHSFLRFVRYGTQRTDPRDPMLVATLSPLSMHMTQHSDTEITAVRIVKAAGQYSHSFSLSKYDPLLDPETVILEGVDIK